MFANNIQSKYARPGQKVFVCCDKAVAFNGSVFKIGESFPDYTRRLEALPARKIQVELKISLTRNALSVNVANAPFAPYTVPVNLSSAEKHPVDSAKILSAFSESDSTEFALAASSCAEIDGNYFFPAA